MKKKLYTTSFLFRFFFFFSFRCESHLTELTKDLEHFLVYSTQMVAARLETADMPVKSYTFDLDPIVQQAK